MGKKCRERECESEKRARGNGRENVEKKEGKDTRGEYEIEKQKKERRNT